MTLPLRREPVTKKPEAVGYTSHGHSGYTLLELLLALSLMVIVLGMVWNLMRLYSSHYVVAENRVGRAQLVRSLARLLNDDLTAVIGDPVHPLLAAETTENGLIRRFGIRGGRDWLTIDVVAPNLLNGTTASSGASDKDSENTTNEGTGLIGVDTTGTGLAGSGREGGGSSSFRRKQVPELKTIFYQFVSPGARQGAVTSGDAEDVTGGSAVVGSLRLPPGIRQESPLVARYGLSRRELDFETPETEDSRAAASITALSKIGSLSSDGPTLNANAEAESLARTEPHRTAPEIAMDRENDTDWAPEVVDCRFQYFDGHRWQDSWDSIAADAPPLAVSVTLTLLPLDQLDTLRQNGDFLAWCRRSAADRDQENGQALSGSSFAGTRTAIQTTTPGKTLRAITESLGLSPPIVRTIVSRLGTTPLANHRLLERRHPTAETSRDQTAFPDSRVWRESDRTALTDRSPAPREFPKTEELEERQWQDRPPVTQTLPDRNTRRPLEEWTEESLFDAVDANLADFASPENVLEPAHEPIQTTRPASTGPHSSSSWIRNH